MHSQPPYIIAVVNQKGGVGKTTTAINLATALSAVGHKTLLLDLDPQGNTSTGVGLPFSQRRSTIYDVIVGKIPFDKAVHSTIVPGLFAVPATVDLSAAEIELSQIRKREFVLKQMLAPHQKDYRYIIIDCPPSLGLLTVNALVAATSILIPTQCEFFALEGLSHLLRTVELVKTHLNPALRIRGVLLTMVDKRNRLTDEVEQEVRKYFGELVYQTMIPRNIRLAEAPSHGKPALIYDMRCPGSTAYLHLAREILQQDTPSEPNPQPDNTVKEHSAA